MGQSSADADEVAAGLRDALGGSAPATVGFAEFVRCYHWRATPAGQGAPVHSFCASAQLLRQCLGPVARAPGRC